MNKTWLHWIYTFIYTYHRFISYIRDENISTRTRQEYFYQHIHLYYEELHKNKSDLYYVSNFLCD